MTREEAIERLNIHKSTSVFVDSIAEAIDMAIESLQNQPKLHRESYERGRFDAQTDLLSEPNRKPDYSYEAEMVKRLKAYKPSGDLISRADAIRWVKTECNPYGKPTLEFESGKRVIEHLKQMPSADRPKGEWIPHTTSVGLKHYTEYARCSECGEMALVHMNFCPNCGAIMKKGGDDE